MADSLTAPKILTLPGPNISGTYAAHTRVAKVTLGVPAGTDVEVDAIGTYQVWSVPAGCVVLSIRSRIITAFTATLTMTLGDGDSAAGYLDSTEIAPTTAETAGVYKNSVIQANAYSGGKKYLAADTIDAVIAVAVPAAGLMEILIEYVDGTAGVS